MLAPPLGPSMGKPRAQTANPKYPRGAACRCSWPQGWQAARQRLLLLISHPARVGGIWCPARFSCHFAGINMLLWATRHAGRSGLGLSAHKVVSAFGTGVVGGGKLQRVTGELRSTLKR
jgi:hypothetical protein